MTESYLSLPIPSAVKIFESQTYKHSSDIQALKHYTKEIWVYNSLEVPIITSNHNWLCWQPQ